MAKTKISQYDSTAANNTDVDGINIAESCPPSGINNAIREVMAHLKDFQSGVSGDTLPIASGGTGGGTATAAKSNLGAASSGANSDITSLSGLTTPLSVAQGGTGSTTAATGTGGVVLSTSPSLASPTLTGTTAAPTPTAGDSSTKIATTAYIQTSGYNSQGKKVVSTSAPSTTTGYVNGDIWYQY